MTKTKPVALVTGVSSGIGKAAVLAPTGWDPRHGRRQEHLTPPPPTASITDLAGSYTQGEPS